MDFKYILVFYGLFISSDFARSQVFHDRPENTATVQHDSAKEEFKCATDQTADYMLWQDQVTGIDKWNFITNGNTNFRSPVYILTTTNNRYDLQIPRNTSNVADVRCGILNPTSYRAAKYIVLESDPVCTVNVTGPSLENEKITYTCEVEYAGDLQPKMQWSTGLRTLEEDEIVDESVDGHTKVSYVVQATPAKHGSKYSCDTFFETPPNLGADFATNAPSYTNKYESPLLVVHWPPKEIKILPEGKTDFHVGDVITCQSESSPSVDHYEWTDVTGNNTVIDAGSDAMTITVLEEWIGSRTLKVEVRNTMRDGQTGTESYEFNIGVYVTTTPPSTTTVTEPSTKEPTSGSTTTSPPALNTGAIVGIAFGCAAALVITFLIIYCLCFRRKPTKETEANNTRPQKPVPADQVRRPDQMDTLDKNSMTPAPYDNAAPPPYDGAYDDPYSQHQVPQNRNVEGLVYADLALDDTPRSRKPIQFGTLESTDSTLYADIRPQGPMV